MVKSIPDGFHSITPMMVVKDARKAIQFYKDAFGAEELALMPAPDGKGVMHAELRIGSSILMMGEEHPEQQCRSAEALGGSPISFYLYVENVDKAFQRALEAGARTSMPVVDMFWGDRMGTVEDPFGYSWSLATHQKDLSPQEMEQAARQAFAEMALKDR